MPSRRILSWPKRQSGPEPYYRTGGLLPIDSIKIESCNDIDAKAALKVDKRRPSTLRIVPSDDQQYALSPITPQYSAGLVSSVVSGFQPAFNDMLPSPVPTVTACSTSASIQKPLPSPSRAVPVPSIAELPAELRSSILLENRRDSSCTTHMPARPITHIIRSESHPPCRPLDALNLASAPIAHARSVSELSSRYSTTRTTWSSIAFDFDTPIQPSLPDLPQKHHSRRHLLKSPPPIEDARSRKRNSRHGPDQVRYGVGREVKPVPWINEEKPFDREIEKRRRCRDKAASRLDPTKVHNHYTQDQTISTLQAEFDDSKAASEAQVKDPVLSHQAEVSSLKDQQRSSQPLTISPDMEDLKRKLSSTRRPETTAVNLLPELNQYKLNNAALQKQIESLMAKLSESKKNEREFRNTLGRTEMKCAEWEDKAGYADKLAKTTQALENTVDHLESRLEVANVKRLDAEEQLSNLKHQKSSFDLAQRKLHVSLAADQSTLDGHTRMGTAFSNTSSGVLEVDYHENSKLAALIAHIERLQDQVSEKDAYITELEKDRERIKKKYDHLEQEHNKITMQSDIQGDLLQETRPTDRHIEPLRTAAIDRKASIKENEQNTRALERQLEHHKLLLQAEIRRHAAMKVHIAEEEEPLPELTALARRKDIDRWMEKLHERLRRERSKSRVKALPDTPDAQMESLRHEIDFYVREIILFKLDIKGYKSDIRKLKNLTAQISSHERPSDNDSGASSRSKSATPVQPHIAPKTPKLDASDYIPPAVGDTTASRSIDSNLPSRSASSQIPQSMVIVSTNWPTRDIQQQLGLEIPRLSWQLTHQNHCSNEADRIDSGTPPSSNAPLSAGHQKSSACVLAG